MNSQSGLTWFETNHVRTMCEPCVKGQIDHQLGLSKRQMNAIRKDEFTVKKEVSLMVEKIKEVAGIDTQPSFTQSIVSDLCEMHQFDEYIIVFRKSDRIAWV